MALALDVSGIKQNAVSRAEDTLGRVGLDKLTAGRNLEQEFQQLDDFCRGQQPLGPPRATCHVGPKDQCSTVLPYRENAAETLNGSYINASVMNSSYRQNFIAAQGPLPSTVEDFWSMIAKNRATQIVALCGDDECADYLPKQDEPLEFLNGDLVISFKGEEALSYGLFVQRVAVTSSDDSWEVERVHCAAWSDKSKLSSSDFLALAELVNVKGKESTTVVHCKVGAGRTGCLLALCGLLGDLQEQVRKLDGMPCVSVAQTVVSLRLQRQHMVQTLCQYESIYAALAEWGRERFGIESSPADGGALAGLLDAVAF